MRIPVAEIASGMVLACDVMDDAGHVLLGEGTALNESHRAILERRGVESINIQNPEAEDAAPAAPTQPGEGETSDDEAAAAARRVAEVEHAFKGTLDDPRMAELFRIVVKKVRQGDIRG